MIPVAKTDIGLLNLDTEKVEDILTHKTSISLNEESVYFSVEYKIFKGYKKDPKTGELILKTEFGKPDSQIPTYNTFSVNRVFKNNFFGIEKLELLTPEFNTEEKVKTYFRL